MIYLCVNEIKAEFALIFFLKVSVHAQIYLISEQFSLCSLSDSSLNNSISHFKFIDPKYKQSTIINTKSARTFIIKLTYTINITVKMFT